MEAMEAAGEAITSSVDDSAIERASTFKQLASWGGFRRAFVEGEVPPGDTSNPAPAAAVSGAVSKPPPPAGMSEETWQAHLHEQLMAKRAEVLATQRKLESLSLEQQELEALFMRQRAPP